MLKLTIDPIKDQGPVSYSQSGKIFMAEASDLGLPKQHYNSLNKVAFDKAIELTNLNRNTKMVFEFKEAACHDFVLDGKKDGEEVDAWIFKSKEGVEFHIIND